MKDSDKIRIVTRLSAILREDKGTSPLVLAARIAEAVEEALERDSKIHPIDATDEVVDLDDETVRAIWNNGKKDEAPTPPPAPPSSGSGRMIIAAGDKEFQDAIKFSEAERRGVITSGLRVSRVGRPTEGSRPVEYQTYESIIRKIEESTPKELWFTPRGAPKKIQVHAVRNHEAGIGLGHVRLKYFNPGVSGDGGVDMATENSPVVIGLIAHHEFYLTDRNLDFDAAMSHILNQLEAMYEGKIGTHGPGERRTLGTIDPGPSALDPGGWNANMPGMKDEAAYQTQSGWGEVGGSRRQVTTRDGRTYSVADPLGMSVDSIVQQNKELGNRD